LKYQIKKWFNNNWYDIDIENIRKDDVIKIFKEDGEELINDEKENMFIVRKDAYEDDNGWNIKYVTLSDKEFYLVKQIEMLKNNKG
jgi:hypothetical protein